MRTLNLGILAHVDAGKTSLTERLLHNAGIIDEIGRVDDGNTQTDTLALERQRGITIRSAVVSFAIGDLTINLIDTPGHPDFIAEVERVLSVLDGAVLVISAVEGVQAQTRVLMRTLRRLRIPTLLFVNKIDRGGADTERVLRDISGRLLTSAISMGSAREQGSTGATFTPYGGSDAGFVSRLVDELAEHDDDFLTEYVDGEAPLSFVRLRDELASQSRRGLVHPVFAGSAVTGAGVDSLVEGIKNLLPTATGCVEGPVAATTFKVERGAAGEKIAYVRVFSGAIRTRDRVRFGRDDDAVVTGVAPFDHGGAERGPVAVAGQIAKLWGLAEIRIGDTIGDERPERAGHWFAPPTLETVVVPHSHADLGALRPALAQLAEQDPLINLRQDDLRQEISVSLYGEVQKEVIQATLADDFGVAVSFRETTTICVERVVGTGAAAEFIGVEPNPFLGTVGLRVEPGTLGSGVEFRLEVELGSMPRSFLTAVEETVRATLQEGLHGWQVIDCKVTMTHSGYWARQSSSHGVFDKSMSSTAGDFRLLTPLVLMRALRSAGTVVHEPIHRFRVEIPADAFGPVLPLLAVSRAVPEAPILEGSTCVLEGEIPAVRLHELEQRLPALTRGEGVLECSFHRYQPVRDAVASRPRTDHNPLDRSEYLRHVQRRL